MSEGVGKPLKNFLQMSESVGNPLKNYSAAAGKLKITTISPRVADSDLVPKGFEITSGYWITSRTIFKRVAPVTNKGATFCITGSSSTYGLANHNAVAHLYLVRQPLYIEF